jgi:hypothetical protein
MELLQREEMQLNGTTAKGENASKWSSCREKKKIEWLNGKKFPS